jgi:hypothetical protein
MLRILYFSYGEVLPPSMEKSERTNAAKNRLLDRRRPSHLAYDPQKGSAEEVMYRGAIGAYP